MNYTELSQAVTDWLENAAPTFISNKDLFIQLGERRIHMALELPAARKNADTTLIAQEPYLQLPADVIMVLDLAVVVAGVHTLLRKKEEGFIREAYPDPTAYATPIFYSIFDHNTLLLGPTPDAADMAEMTYHGVPESIVTANTTWLGTNCYRALLYGAMAEGYRFMKGEADMIAEYDKAFEEEVVKMNALVVRKAYLPGMVEGSV